MTSRSLKSKDLTSEVPMPNANSDIEKATEVQEPFSIFSVREKWFIVSLISFGGLFSPLTANIYLPAIPALTRAFQKSTELINVTVTVYMVFQGISPMLFGTLADRIGRRPIFSACLLILSLSCVGLALVPTSAYWLLVLLRCIQAAGSASTIALGAGVIGDISTPAERGGFFGVYNIGPNLGPALGPVIGGLLSDHLGWRAIFWFLCIASLGCFMILVLFLPETLRSLVGNGAAVPSKLYRPLIPIIGRRISSNVSSSFRPDKKPFKNPLLLLRDWDIVLLLFVTGITNALYYGVIASISSLFEVYYPALSETQIGLCYLATAGGMMLGTTLTGRLLDLEYKATVKAMAAANGEASDILAIRSDFGIADDFPIEKARLRILPPLMLMFSACLTGYGWCIERRVNLAGPLILQAAVGFAAMSSISAVQTLIIDWVPTQGSSVTACNNLIRCSLGAGLVVLMEPLLAAIDPGWTYVLLGGIGLLTIPLVWLVVRIGPSRRRMRKQRARDEASR